MTDKYFHMSVACLLTVLVAASPAKAQVPVKEIGVLSSTTVRIVQAATPVFLQTGLDIAPYRAEIFETDRSYVVLFQDANFDRPPGHRGSSPHRPEYEVELEKSSLKLLGSHFVR